MRCINKKHLREFYEKEAKSLAHQEVMYLKGNKHELWWHRKRLYFVISFLSEIFEKDKISTFADIGCAEGFYVKYIASVHNETLCIGADVARIYVKKAKRDGTTSNSEYIVCDVEHLPFKENSIDVVLCSEVLEHTYNYRKALFELYKAGKKWLVISFPGHSALYGPISKIKLLKSLVDKLMPYVGHISEVKVRDVQEFLKGKYTVLDIKIGGALPTILFKIIPSVRMVDLIDNILCKNLRNIGLFDYSTIHVIKIMKS